MNYQDFLQKYETLKASFPKEPNVIINSEKSFFGDVIVRCQNVYYGFDAVETQNSFYMYDAYQNKSCIDCSYVAFSELCHECIDCDRCYGSSNLSFCDNCTNCSFCFACSDCQDCFGCVALKSKRFCFFNKQLTEKEYKSKVQEYSKKSQYEISQQLNDLKETFPKGHLHGLGNTNSDFGYYHYRNNDCYYIFDAVENVSSGYVYDSHRNKNCYDATYSIGSELCYDITDTVNSYKGFSSKDLHQCTDCYFSHNLNNCQNCLGCVNLANQQYCILNKKYEPAEYEKLKNEILASMPR